MGERGALHPQLNFYFAQKLREHNREAIEGTPRIHAKLPTSTGDTDFIEWNISSAANWKMPKN